MSGFDGGSHNAPVRIHMYRCVRGKVKPSVELGFHSREGWVGGEEEQKYNANTPARLMLLNFG